MHTFIKNIALLKKKKIEGTHFKVAGEEPLPLKEKREGRRF